MTETVFASDTTNIGTVTTSDLEGGFGGCGGDGIPMTSANFNKVINWLSNINWDGIPFTDLANYNGKDFPISTVTNTTLNDYLYIRRGSKVYKIKADQWFQLAFSQAYEQLPIGLKVITEDIPGAFTTVLTGVSNYPGWTGTAFVREVVLESEIVFPVSQFPGLATAGINLEINPRVWTMLDLTGSAIQWDFNIFANGIQITNSSDAYLLTNDYSGFIGSELKGTWVTNGNDLTIKVIQFATYSAASIPDVIGSVVEIDLSRVVASISLA